MSELEQKKIPIKTKFNANLLGEYKLEIALEVKNIPLEKLKRDKDKFHLYLHRRNPIGIIYELTIILPKAIIEEMKNLNIHMKTSKIIIYKKKKLSIQYCASNKHMTILFKNNIKNPKSRFLLKEEHYWYSYKRYAAPDLVDIDLKLGMTRELYQKSITSQPVKKINPSRNVMTGNKPKIAKTHEVKLNSSSTPRIRISNSEFRRCGNCFNLSGNNHCGVHQTKVSYNNICSRFYAPRLYYGGGFSPK